MQKTCKSEVCKRKLEKTSLSDLCPPCAHAYKSGETQNQRRLGNSTRQTKARGSSFDNNRELSGFTFPPPHTTTTTQSMPTHSDTLTAMTSPSSQSVVTPSSTATIDVDTLNDNFQSMSGAASAPAGPSNDQFKDLYGMLVHL